MARNAFDFIKSIIRDQTVRTPGIVGNLYGVVAEAAVVDKATFDQTWFVLTTEAKALLTLREFVDSYSYQRAPSVVVSAREGSTVYPAQGSLPAGQAVLLLTRINVPGPTVIPVAVTANGYEYAIYADDQRVASGRGSGRHSVMLGVGEHFLRILCFGGTTAVQVDVPEEFHLAAAEPLPPPPILQGNPVGSYLSAGNGSYVVDVKWANDAAVTEWAVYRATGIASGEIVDVLAGPSTESLVFRVLGALTYVDDEEFYTPLLYAGTILSMSASTAVVDGATVVSTDITVQLEVSAPTDASSWLGQQFMRVGAPDPMGRVTYAGQPVLTFRDTAVKPRTFYVYWVTAFSLLTASAESDYSEPGWVYVADLVPPGAIVFDAATDLRLLNGTVVLDYTTPGDEDYQGVQVYVQEGADYTLLTTEYGPVNGTDQLTFRPPHAGTYYFRTIDSAGNVQAPEDAATWTWDGKQEWINSVHGLLLATVDAQLGTADLSLDVTGPAVHFPVQIRFFQGDLTSPLELAPGVTSYEMAAPGHVDSATYPVLAGIPLPLTGAVQWWAEITDADGYTVYAYSSADRGAKPQGSVVSEDYQAFPSLTVLYDEDVEEIEVQVPTTDSSGVLGSVTYTRGSGLPVSGAGSVTYDVGDTVTKADTSTTTEVAIPVEGARGPYRVYVRTGATRILIWEGKLHGDSVKEPTVEARVVLDATLRNAVDVYVTPTSPVGEQLRVEFKSDSDPSVPLWQLVSGNSSSTARYVASGVEVAPTSYFKKEGVATWAQSLNNIALASGQIRRIAIRAVGKDSGIAGAWIIVPLPLEEAGEMSSVDLGFDKTSSTLVLTGIAGKFTQSAQFEISDAEDFSANTTSTSVNVATGAKATFTRTLAESDYDKRWYGRVTGYNGSLVSGSPSGLGGIALRDSELVLITGVGANGAPAVVGVLSNDYQAIPTDSAGNNGNFTDAKTTLSVYVGATDDSANWTVVAAPSAGVTGSLVGRTYTVTALSTDTGYVDLTASRPGYASVTKRFALGKVKAGTQGDQGDSGVSRSLHISTAAIQKSTSNVYTPATITVNATSTTGTGNPTPYSGRFVISDTTDGTTWTARYTSSSDQSSYTYTPRAGILALKVGLYLGGTAPVAGTLIDQQTVPVVKDGLQGTPGVSACTLNLDASSDLNPAITITAFPTTATVVAFINGIDVTSGLTNLGSGVYKITLTRSAAINQTLLVQATASGYAAQSATYSIDRDPTPGFSNIAAPIPLYAVSRQDGWWINGGVDDDTKQVAIEVTGGVTLRSANPAAVSGVMNTDTIKTISVTLDQAAGTKGTVTLTPKDGSVSGEPWSMELSLAPNTTVTLSEITSTIRRVTLQTDPATGVINATAKKASDGTGVKTYTNPAVNDVNAPSTRQGTGTLTFYINLKDAPTTDILIEYYAVVSTTANGEQVSVTEGVKQQRIDSDDAPEVSIVVSGGENTLTISATPDDDVSMWRLWARRLQSPIPAGSTDPDNRYLYFEGGQQDKTVSLWAKEGDWYVIARAYDYAGRFTESKPIPSQFPFTVTVAPSTAAALSNVAGVRQDNTSGTDYHQFTWGHNSAVTSTSGHVVKVLESGAQVAQVGAYTDAAQVATPEQKTSAEANAVFRRYEYTVQLVDSGGGVVGSYPLVIEGYYDDGTVTVAAPTEVPGTPFLVWTGGAHPAKATWTNTSDVWSIEVTWMVNGLGSTQKLAPGVATASIPVTSGDEVMMKLRYYNEGGNGTWSAWSNTVTVG